MYAAALGIEILCIMSAEIGENIGLYTFGFNLHGIVIAYVLGYALAGFSTFMTILGDMISILIIRLMVAVPFLNRIQIKDSFLIYL